MVRSLAASILLAAALVGIGAAPTFADTKVTSGSRSLTVSRSLDLDPAGDEVQVTGSGYDERHGIYVAFCVVNGPGVTPGPCGGGIDTAGSSGSSAWISSNPPPYGVGLAVPYGPGGSFALTLRVSATINGDIDCAVVRCAVVTRDDHTRSDDRGQDVLVPVTFRADGAGSASIGTAGQRSWISLGLGSVAVASLALLAVRDVVGRRRSRREPPTGSAA